MTTLSPYLIAVLMAWVVAQGTKLFIAGTSHQATVNYKKLYASGDMPSSHSAVAVALATTIGLKDGVTSSVFAIAFLFAVIVMYDALMVRRSTGEQGEALQALIKEQKSNVRLPRAAKGHEPLEVIAGALVGFVVGLLSFLLVY